MRRAARIPILLALLLAGINAAAADESCVDFKWDVTQERALFAGTALPLVAGTDAKSAPVMLLNHLYALQLTPQDKVTFAATPGKKSPSPGSSAGIVTFRLPASGSYRIALDMPFWIDVVANGALVAAKDFQGQHGCNSPHKIVEFELPSTRPYLLQLSSAAPNGVHVTITATPTRNL
jgi:hypothetical protein